MTYTGRLFGRVIKIRIHGPINDKLERVIYRGLRKATYIPSSALIVKINSSGGSLTKARNISEMLNNFKKDKDIRLYCFAQDTCLGSANIILTSADKCFATNMSLMGGLGFAWRTMNLHKWQQKYGIHKQIVSVNESPLKYDQYRPLKPQTQEFIKTQLRNQTQTLKQILWQNRKAQMAECQYNMQELQQQLVKSPITTSQYMIKFGLIDGIKTNWIDEQYPKDKIYNINPVTYMSVLHSGPTASEQQLNIN